MLCNQVEVGGRASEDCALVALSWSHNIDLGSRETGCNLQRNKGRKERGVDAMSVNGGRGNFSGENLGSQGVLAGSASSVVRRGREPEEAPVYTAL